MQSFLRISQYNITLVVVVLYSVVMIFSGSPAIQRFSNYTTLVYYLLIPGYAFTLLLGENYNLVWRLFYSVIVGLAVVLSIASLGSSVFGSFSTPLNVIIPAICIMISIYLYVRTKIHY